MNEITFEFNEAIIKQLEKSPEVQDQVKIAAEKIAAKAREIAPVESGDYRDSIHVEKSNKSGSNAWIVLAHDPRGWIEFGAPVAGKKGHFTLRNAIEASGYELAKKSK